MLEVIVKMSQPVFGASVFGKFGFDEGVAGHFTVRDPEKTDHFWVNPFGRSFKQMKVSDLILVNHSGDIVEGALYRQCTITRDDDIASFG